MKMLSGSGHPSAVLVFRRRRQCISKAKFLVRLAELWAPLRNLAPYNKKKSDKKDI